MNPDDAALLAIARRQLATVLEARDDAAFLGWWLAWSAQQGVSHDDLIDMIKAAGLDPPA